MSNGRLSTANKVRIAAAFAGLLIVIILIFQNRAPVQAYLLFFPVQMPVALLLIITLLIGFGAGMLASWVYLSRRR